MMRVQAGRPIACVAAEAIPGSTGQTNDAGKPILARSSSYMIHLDVKKVGRIPPKGGWRAHGRGTPEAKASKRGKSTRIGYTYLHTAIDGFSRLAYTEALDDEKASTTIGFFCRARTFFAAHGITRLVRVVTDNGASCRAQTFTTNHLFGLTPPEDPSLHPTSQRQGRAIQPHPGRGVPLRTPLLLTAAAPRCRRGVEPPRQRPSTPHHLRQPGSCHLRPSTRYQRHDLIHLGEGQPLPRWSLGVLQRLGRC